MTSDPNLSFENTEVAFSYKSDAELARAKLIFSVVNHPWISSLATGFVKLAFKLGLPVESLVRKTAFAHFCGGESIEDSQRVIALLGRHGVGTILDYSVEGESSEEGFTGTMEEIIRTIRMAAHSLHIPFCVFKLTGIGSAALLEKITNGQTLSEEEHQAYARVRERAGAICESAYNAGVPVLIDAEETWVQEPIDNIADEMMAKYNRERAIVYNTYQMYRVDSMDNLLHDYEEARRQGYFVGAKLVRGAYMEKERARAAKAERPSPIYADKAGTDSAFNRALEFCVAHLDHLYLMCGSHNDRSTELLVKHMADKRISPSDKRIWFAQLYGMSDHLSFNLARAGYNVAKYVPYGPVRAVMPYLLRRAEENTSVAGQSSRELTLIRRELARRRKHA